MSNNGSPNLTENPAAQPQARASSADDVLSGERDPHSAKAAQGERNVAVVIIHGVGETVPGDCIELLTSGLERRYGAKAGVTENAGANGTPPSKGAATLADFDPRPYSEFHRLPQKTPERRHSRPLSPDALAQAEALLRDPAVSAGQEPPPDQFPSVVRRGFLPNGGRVTFAELFWADLTRPLPGRVNSILSIFAIIFESHHFIDAMLDRTAGGLTGLLRRLLLIASGMLRGPIFALNACLILIALGFFVTAELSRFFKFADPGLLIIYVSIGAMVMLLLVSLFYLRRYRQIAETEWADAFVALAIVSVLVIAVIVLAKRGIVRLAQDPGLTGSDALGCSYANTLYDVLQGAWFVWCLLVLLAYVVTAVLRIEVLFQRRGAQPAAVGAALTVVLVQAVLWNTLVATLLIPLLDQADSRMINTCSLGSMRWIFAVTVVFGGLFAVFGLFLLLIRRLATKLTFIKRERLNRLLPRLVINRWLLFVVMIGALAHILVFLVTYSDQYFGNNALLKQLQGYIDHQSSLKELVYRFGNFAERYKSIGYFLISAAAILFFYLFSNGFGTVIHIARDLIDHHYSPELGYSYYLFPKAAAHTVMRPRRRRIRRRLEVLMRDLVALGGYDTLIFVAHSQGTVILYDFLQNHDAGNKRILGMRPHIITLGSPLNYLYEYYFHEYRDMDKSIKALRPGISTWSNLFRVDDFIGGKIDSVPFNIKTRSREDTASQGAPGTPAGPLVVNEVLGPGGHTDYWSEERVSNLVFALLRHEGVV